ncbi:hypothetical protein [Ferruginibacter sp.]
MTEDLISNNFIDNIEKRIVKKVLSLSRFVLAMVLVYNVLDVLDWYIAISRYPWDHEFKTSLAFFEFRIRPFIALFLITVYVFIWALNIRGNKLMVLAVENEDADIFNNAYRIYYKGLKLSIVSLCISIISITIRLFLN